MRVLAFVGHSNAGKTTLLEKLVPELETRGLRVGVLKHSSHPHALHAAGSDTERLEAAGARVVGFATPHGLQLTRRAPSGDEALAEAIRRLAGELDLLLVEGWKEGPLPKWEVWREGLAAPLAERRPDILAVVSPTPETSALPSLVEALLRDAKEWA